MKETTTQTKEPQQKFILIAAEGDDAPISAEASLRELRELLTTAGGEWAGDVIQKRENPHPKTYLGTGKMEELKAKIEETGADGVIADDELTPAQLKAMSELLPVKVLDRTLLILDIFTQRAATKEGMMQVELAQLNYRLTRLTGMGTELSRQGASVGGVHSRGAGESKLELDRRYIRRRIDRLNRQLKEIEQQRALLRERREQNEVPVVALVGYTNAGKSTLFNRLTEAGVTEEDKLFATLDTTMRRCVLPGGREVLLSDTVGFIHKLPHHLVKAFRATLEEAAYADILVHVVDDSDENAPMQARVTYETLQDLKAADKPILTVLNKQDRKAAEAEPWPLPYTAEQVLRLSALRPEDPPKILSAVEELLQSREEELCVLLPYTQGALADRLHRNGRVLQEEYRDDGIFLRVCLKERYAEEMRPYRVEEAEKGL